MTISLEMNFDLGTIERNLYTILDLCSDVGGLAGTLVWFLNTLILLLNRHGFVDIFLISKLYKVPLDRRRQKAIK